MNKTTLLLLSTLLSFFLVTPLAHAQFLEAYGIVQQMNGDNTTSGDMLVNVADNTSGGFGAGFNMGNVNMNIDFLFGSTDVQIDDVVLDVKLFFFDANIDYAILSGPIAPLLTAGIGSVNFVDSYVTVDGLNENDFSTNVGAGLKLCVRDHYLVKALYRSTWTQIKYTDSKVRFDGVCIQAGYLF
ncbi:outer membrane beta-barrel protein [candidate division KSB1 bacterium]|nr:outer membrane beta-barrel protein [candidate division KSB1 bacterium]